MPCALEIIQQYEALQPQGPHDNVGDDGEQDEEDETFAAFQAAANLQCNVSQIIDDFLAERGGRTEDGQGRVLAAPQDMAAASSAPVPRMSEEEWHANKGKMNASQKAVFQGVQDHLRCSQQHASTGTPAPPPLHWFITGGAGVGKSFVMNLVRELIIRACGADVNAVKMTAPTGVAAFNISGVTLHQALKLPVQDGHGAADRGTAYRELEGERLEDLRASWRNVKYLIIDEISMVGHFNFDFVHRRLCEIFGVRLPFGGISVLAVGDFFQLPPVKSGWIFFSRLWKDHFRMKELTENQRQIYDTGWAARLNVIRAIKKGDDIQDTMEVLKTRCSTSIGGPVHEGHDWRDAPRLVATVLQQNEYNEMRLNDLTNVVHLEASHAYINPRGVVARDDAIPDNIRGQIPQDIDNCGGLAQTVRLAVGARVMLRRNLDTPDGLVNGVLGTVVGFRWPSRRDEEQGHPPSDVMIKFDHPNVGRRTRVDAGSMGEYTPIGRATARFRTSNGRHVCEANFLCNWHGPSPSIGFKAFPWIAP
eukprot:jgi/Botrbrau1/22550/Bobra.114_2s0073.1